VTEIFSQEAMLEANPKWPQAILRVDNLYDRPDDIRTPFARDYNRILHCKAYRRQKHKTQVFFATTNDHICTRIEHVNHVAAISYTISKYLGLNTQLTNAIAIGHDLGHAPFGHAGGDKLKQISHDELELDFWHESNSLRFVDFCETLEGPDGNHCNLSLTYAVRDGIISHCGEVDENALKPREEPVDLHSIQRHSQYQPYTWEGCVVKISDKIAYLGRDIEDALTLRILSLDQIRELKALMRKYEESGKLRDINNTVIIHRFVTDLCKNSTPDSGIKLSDTSFEIMNVLKDFNYKNIYNHPRLKAYTEYAELIIQTIYNTLSKYFDRVDPLVVLSRDRRMYPILIDSFSAWLIKYGRQDKRNPRCKNKIIYDITDDRDYKHAIIDYISAMTDSYAISIFQELTSFR
jgi:dGTPase